MKFGRKIVLGILILFGLNACVGLSPDGRGYTIEVPLSNVNTTVAQNFPKSKEITYGKLVIDDANILSKQGANKLGVGSSFTFSNMLIPNGIKGSVKLSSGVRYNRSDRGLYLANPMVDEITLQNFALSKYVTPQMRNVIGDIIAKQLMKKPIYSVNNIGSSFVKDIGVKNGNIVITVGM